MPVIAANIKSTNWQISKAGFGMVAEGFADIRQCIEIILRTPKGSDSLRPEFGSELYKYIDYPVNVAVPNMKRCIIQAISIWEKRIKLVSISHLIVNEQVYFYIKYQPVDQELIDSIFFSGDGGVTDDTGLILQAFYPPNPYGLAYKMDLSLDDSAALPSFPENGFSTLMQLFAWVSGNWGAYGRWVMLMDRIVLYAAPQYKSGSISISLITGLLKVEALLPQLQPGESYGIEFLPDGALPAPPPPTGLITPEQLLLWAQANWAAYGSWSIESGTIDVFGDFNPAEFSGEFNTGGTGNNYYLVLNSTVLYTATLTVNPV